MDPPPGPSGTPVDRPWVRHYERGVPPTVEVPDRRLDALVGERLAGWPDRPALLFYRARWSYRRFWDEAGAFAAALRADGVGPGDRVALYLPNCPLYPIAFFGALRAGAVVVQVSPLYRSEDLDRLLRDADVRAAVSLEILYPFLEPVARSVGIPRVFVARLRDFYPALLRPFVTTSWRFAGAGSPARRCPPRSILSPSSA